MKSLILRRLDALEAQAEARADPEESPKQVLLRKLGLLRPESEHAMRWEHYPPKVIAFEAHCRLERCEREAVHLVARLEAFEAGVGVYPVHLSTPAQQRQHREHLAAEITSLMGAVRLLTAVRTAAGLDLGRPVEPHSHPLLLPNLANVSDAELVAMHGRYVTSHPHPTESEIPPDVHHH